MGQCNHCTLRDAKKRCKEGEIITVLDGKRDGILPTIGKDIYRHSSTIDITSLSEDEREKYWIMWLMELPGRCAC